MPPVEPPPAPTVIDLVTDRGRDRSRPTSAEPPLTLQALPRPTLGGPAFLRTYLTARVLGRLHPRLARRSLMRLWFTPWVHPSALKPVDDLPDVFTTWSLPAGGRTLQGYAGGAGATIVLVHGWAGRAADWRHLANDLVTAGWRVVVPDLPAHGTTTGRQTDLFELSRALADVLDAERPVAIVAHSMGFPTTLLAIEEGAPGPAALVALAPGRRMAHALAGFSRRAGLRPALVSELRRGIEARFGADIWDTLDVDRVVPDLAAKGLVVHDTDDDEVPAVDAQQIADRWTGARLVTTEGLGHRRILRDEAVRAVVVDALV